MWTREIPLINDDLSSERVLLILYIIVVQVFWCFYCSANKLWEIFLKTYLSWTCFYRPANKVWEIFLKNLPELNMFICFQVWQKWLLSYATTSFYCSPTTHTWECFIIKSILVQNISDILISRCMVLLHK